MSETAAEFAAYNRSIVLIVCKTVFGVVLTLALATLGCKALDRLGAGIETRVQIEEVPGPCNALGCRELAAFCPRHK